MASRQRLPARQPVPAGRRGGGGVPGRRPAGRHAAALGPGLAAAGADTAGVGQARLPAADPAAGAARPRVGRAVRAADPRRRQPLPALLRRDRVARRAGRLREPAHLPAGVGRPERRRASAGVRAGAVLRGHQRRRPGGVRVRRVGDRRHRPSRVPGGLRRPDQPDRPLVRDGDVRADPEIRPGDGHRDVPDALPRPGSGRPRGRAVPGDPGRHLPAVGRGGVERGATTSTSGAACSASTPRSCLARPRSTAARTRRSTTRPGRWPGR